jgi:hypothetical protein
VRDAALLSTRFATFAQVTRSTRPTAANRRSSGRSISPEISSRSGTADRLDEERALRRMGG